MPEPEPLVDSAPWSCSIHIKMISEKDSGISMRPECYNLCQVVQKQGHGNKELSDCDT